MDWMASNWIWLVVVGGGLWIAARTWIRRGQARHEADSGHEGSLAPHEAHAPAHGKGGHRGHGCC